MSRATKRKHVLNEVFQESFDLPTDTQQIVQVLSSKGNNLHEVKGEDGTTFLVTMPTKFRKNIWVKRGDYILVEPIKEGDKVKAEMIRTLNSDSIKYFQKEGVWPAAFCKTDDDSVDDVYLFVNTNRITLSDSEENSTDSESEDTDEEQTAKDNDTG